MVVTSLWGRYLLAVFLALGDLLICGVFLSIFRENPFAPEECAAYGGPLMRGYKCVIRAMLLVSQRNASRFVNGAVGSKLHGNSKLRGQSREIRRLIVFLALPT